MSDRPPPTEDDDEFELELEPIDPEILAVERQRAERKTEEVVTKATFDELYEDRPPGDLEFDWSKLRQFRFTTRHLLILTAVLAVMLTLKVQLGGCMSLFVLAMIAIGAGWYSIYRTERREALERARRRDEFLATRAAKGEASTAPSSASPTLPPEPEPEPRRLSEFRFAFSTKQLFITLTAAAVMLGLLRLIGPKALTITLGAVAVFGLAVQTFGLFDPPPAIVLGWWLLLMLYLALGLLTAIWPEIMMQGLRTPLPSGTSAVYAEC